ncbi:MAG: hypothetical protein L3J51_03125 [Cocleimonas sp.]|nr:hypothetical protein [Cocleimonas sp.]
MKRITLSAFIVLALITIDLTISMAYAKSNVKIFKVTKVSVKNKLRLRAWPSPKSRVKVSLPYNAVDLVATGKKKSLKKSKWIEVTWQNNKGWVNARYLKKTGALPALNTTVVAVSSGSRNITKGVTRSVAQAKSQTITKKATVPKALSQETPQRMPQMPTENRYYQPTQLAAREVKTTYSPNRRPSTSNKVLRCIGSSPRPWSIKMNVADKKMQVNFKGGQSFNVPINYHEWASSNEIRMNIGGNKGRNIVDVNLEKTDACSTGLSRTNYMYEVNATINRDFFSGCCETVSH